MHIGILSRNRKLYSTKRLKEEAEKIGATVSIIDVLGCYLRVSHARNFAIKHKGRSLSGIDVVIPRIGHSVTDVGTTVLRHLELMGVPAMNTADSIVRSRDKIQAYQLLAAKGVPIPETLFADMPDKSLDFLKMLRRPPHVFKLNSGTQGNGVVLSKRIQQSVPMVDAFSAVEQPFVVQEFISEARGADYRVFIVDDTIVGCMKRQAKAGEFRSNLHRGGTASLTELNDHEKQTALLAARSLGLSVAGVDLLRSRKGPLILEVNSSPGLEGIERATGLNIAEMIVGRAVSRVKGEANA